MGVVADGANRAFPSADVDAFLARPRVDIPYDGSEHLLRTNTLHFITAVDPSGGGASAFAVCSMAQLPSGHIVVRCSLLLPAPSASSG